MLGSNSGVLRLRARPVLLRSGLGRFLYHDFGDGLRCGLRYPELRDGRCVQPIATGSSLDSEADLDGSGLVDGGDLGLILAFWS